MPHHDSETDDTTKKRAIKPEDAIDQQPKKKKKIKSSKETPTKNQDEESEASEDEKSTKKSPKNNGPLDHIPQDIRFDPKNLENKPKGLVDALSNFFTPGLKRTSRTAMNSLLKPEAKAHDPTLNDPPKKVRLSVDEKELSNKDDGVMHDRKRHASAGQQQVKSLYDGLSHLYSDCDSRLRSVPMTNYDQTGKSSQSPERIASPHRMSDTELKQKESGGSIKKIKDKGNSKNYRYILSMVWCFVCLA